MKKLFLITTLLLASIAGYSQINTFGGIGLRVNDTTTYQTNAAAYHTAGYYDIYFNNQATNDHWDVWNGSSYDHIFQFNSGSGGGGTPGGSDTQVQFNNSSAFGGDADFTFTGGNTLNVDVAIVDAETFGAGWNGDNSVPTKNDAYDEIILKQYLTNSVTTITDASTMDIAAIKNTLTTSSGTRTFTQSFTGDVWYIELILNTTSCVLTFPATTLTVSEGSQSGNNTLTLEGVSGDKFILSGLKMGSNYYVIGKNFGQ